MEEGCTLAMLAMAERPLLAVVLVLIDVWFCCADSTCTWTDRESKVWSARLWGLVAADVVAPASLIIGQSECRRSESGFLGIVCVCVRV